MAGAQGGTIARDEEGPHGARLTLEVGGGGAPCTLSCAVEGWLLHVRFFGGEDEAYRAFEQTRPALEALAEKLPAAGPRSVEAAALREAHQAMVRFQADFP
jgi:hypothetical protein